jgi:hypothetical protein
MMSRNGADLISQTYASHLHGLPVSDHALRQFFGGGDLINRIVPGNDPPDFARRTKTTDDYIKRNRVTVGDGPLNT